ncbi:MAG: DUF4416 family protein [Deltaproteobacteria bacterium]|nr:DUF4416 family protein [Deltaproteobacteria bacterium]
MGKIGVPKPVKLIMSLITSDDLLLHQAMEVAAQRYGEVDFKSDVLPFGLTGYYTAEMGEGLFRRFITFRPMIPRESLVRIKRETNEVEETFAVEGRRRINIDPGYICAEHLILATTKGYTHRPYLGEGIYADLTLVYQKGEFRPLEWTYPDYASPGIREILNEVRRRYLQELKGGGG